MLRCVDVSRNTPSCCQCCDDQSCAVKKVMFSNVPDNKPAVVFANENSGEVTVVEARCSFSLEEVLHARAF